MAGGSCTCGETQRRCVCVSGSDQPCDLQSPPVKKSNNNQGPSWEDSRGSSDYQTGLAQTNKGFKKWWKCLSTSKSSHFAWNLFLWNQQYNRSFRIQSPFLSDSCAKKDFLQWNVTRRSQFCVCLVLSDMSDNKQNFSIIPRQCLIPLCLKMSLYWERCVGAEKATLGRGWRNTF